MRSARNYGSDDGIVNPARVSNNLPARQEKVVATDATVMNLRQAFRGVGQSADSATSKGRHGCLSPF